MKIGILGLFFSFYISTSAFWFSSRDCIWQEVWKKGLCLEVQGHLFPYGRQDTREKIPARGGGADCIGPSNRITQCSRDEYLATVFLRTITARISSTVDIVQHRVQNGFSFKPVFRAENAEVMETGTRREDVADHTQVSSKCVADVRDEDGNVLMSGRNCPPGKRKKRRVIDDLESMQRRAKRSNNPFLQESTVSSTKNRDVLFLIDESGSVGRANFKKILRLAKALTNIFCGTIDIGKATTRVGVLTFNMVQHPQIDFDKFFRKAHLLNAMENNVRYYGYPTHWSTCLVEALKYTRTTMLTPGHGARTDIPGTERLVILITDGCANCVDSSHLKSNLDTLGHQFNNDGVSIITLLIGDNSNRCFQIMKGLSVGSQCYQQFWARDWAAFDVWSNELEQVRDQCMDAWAIGPSC